MEKEMLELSGLGGCVYALVCGERVCCLYSCTSCKYSGHQIDGVYVSPTKCISCFKYCSTKPNISATGIPYGCNWEAKE